MNNSTDVNVKDDSSEENENGFDESTKSNGFLYVDISDYNEHNLDGIEIKEEEEHVEDLILEKNRIDSNETYFEDSLPLNSLKNLANHSEIETSLKVCIKSKNFKKRREPSSKSIQKENISLKDREENFKPSRYKLRNRTSSKKINYDVIENIAKRKEAKVSTDKKTNNYAGCDIAVLKKKNLFNQEVKKSFFECPNCQKSFCNNTLLDKHLKLCSVKKNSKFSCKINENRSHDKIILRKDPENYKSVLFTCDKCKRNFTKKCNLVSHILKNDCSSEIITCAICEETFVKKSYLKKHIIAHLNNQSHPSHLHKFGNHKCSNNDCFTNKGNDEIITNQKCNLNCFIETDKSNFNCTSTELSNSNGSLELIDNQSSKVSCSTVYKCQICNEIYKGIVSYEKHFKNHRESLRYGCNSKNHNSSKLSNHMRAEHCHKFNGKTKKKFKYERDTCEEGFMKVVKPKIHILNIQQGTNYQCHKCSVKFSNQEDLDTHITRKDCKSEDLCTCQICGKVFAKRDYLKKHQYMHMNVLFKCKYCYCAFMKEKSYKRHMEKMNCSKSARKIRMAEFNYKKCRLCEIEYETEELLIKHFRTSHIGLEPHQCFCCDICLPSFQELQNHLHQHNIQKYTCNLCGKPYTSQEGFRKHRLKHKGAEFKCKFCDSEFLNENRFKFHERTCKKNPESGYEPSQEKEKSKKKEDKPKQSRQLHWESRIIMKRLRGDPKLFSGNKVTMGTSQPDSTVASVFFDEPETEVADDGGWFNNYYKTDEDDITFGLKKADKVTQQDCDSDLEVSEFLQTGSVVTKKKTQSLPSTLTKVINTSITEDREMDNGIDNYSERSSENSSSDSEEEIDAALPIDYNPKKCRLCVISFDQEYELIHHFIKTHPGEFAHKCPQCETQSPLYAQLKEHLKTHGIGIGIFNCDNCSKQFKSEKKMNNHIICCKGIKNKANTSGENSFFQSGDEVCRRCGKKFHSKFGYRRHKQLCKKQNNKSKNLVRFSNDSVKLNSKEETVADYSVESDDFLLPDPDEEEFFKTSNDKTVSENGDLTNNDNSSSAKPAEVSSNATGVQKEEKNNKEVKSGGYAGEPPMDSFPCRLCDKKFQYERGIVMHFKSAHPGHKPLICHVCNMHLADKLKEHLKTHGIGEEFVCELCGKRFNQKFLSKIHEMWHQGIEYKCSNCKQKFLNKEKMDKHVGENRCSNRQSLMRLPCDICGKSYRSKFGLSKHYITHTPKELRPVKNRMNCEYCGKWFEYNNGLQRHRRIHTGERPFCCRFCPKAFAQEGNCKAHERIHTGESKPRKKKSTVLVSSNIPQSTILAPQLPSLSTPLSPHLQPPISTVDSIAYPGHINLYIYNSIDANGIAH